MIVTLSRNGYSQKPERETLHEISFSNYDLSLTEIFYSMVNGHTLSCTFVKPYEYAFHVGKGFRKRDNFNFMHYVMVDLDTDIQYNLEELIEKIKYKPNIAYTTFSHQIDENHGNRYRLLYFFTEPIVNPHLYRELYDKITKDIPCDKDNSAKSPYQFCHGTTRLNPWYQEYFNEDLYCIRNFKCRNKNIPMQDKTPVTTIEFLESASEFFNDIPMLKDWELIAKYSEMYQLITESEMIDVGDIRYKLYPEIYYCTIRAWERFVGEDEKVHSRIHKWVDGEHRRNKMFWIARTIITIKPDITIDALMYNLVWHKVYEFNNSDGVLTYSCLLTIAQDALNSVYEPKPKEKHPLRRYNMDYCRDNHVTWQSIRTELDNKEKYDALAMYYNPDKSLRENEKLMAYYGYDIKKDTINVWVKKQSGVAVGSSINTLPQENNNSDTQTSDTTHKEYRRNQYGKVFPEDVLLSFMDFSKSANWNEKYLKSIGYNVGRKRVLKLYRENKPV